MEYLWRRHRCGIRIVLWHCVCGGLAMLAGLSIASADDLDSCSAADTRPTEGISACTRIIDAGAVQGHALAVAYRNRGVGHFNKREDDEAIADFTRAIELDRNYTPAYRGRGRAMARKGELDRAIVDFNEALRLDPKAVAIYNDRGLAWRMKGDLDRAFEDFNAAIRLDSGYAAAYHNRAYAWDLKGDLERAIADYDEAVRLNPVDAVAYNNRGHLWQHKNDLERAIADYTGAIQADPKFALAYRNRGLAYNRKGDFDRAIADFNQLIGFNPKDIAAIVERGNAWRGKRDTDRAMADYENAITIEPHNGLEYRSHGQALEAKGDIDRAVADYSEAIRINAKDGTAYFMRAFALSRKGALDGSIADYNEVISINPSDAMAHNNRGILLNKKGDIDRAIADFNEAIRLDPGYTGALAHRGLAYESKRDIERARADFTKVLSLPPKYTSGKWAHDTAQVRLAVLTPQAAAPAATPSPTMKSVVETPAGSAPAASQPSIVVPTGPVGARLALVIGNGAYRNAPPLPNPANDAHAIAKTLRDIGFHVIEATDLDRAGMDRVMLDFLQKAPAANVRLLFYAGHGMQVDGNNYLVPVDATVKSKNTAVFELVDIDRILKGLDDEARANIIILDACRDNPFETRIAPSRSAGRGAGLSGYESVGAGTLIAFATAPGNTAADGSGTHSPFTVALLKHIGTPKLEVNQMLTRVRIDVAAATEKKQVPWANSSLLGEVYLSQGEKMKSAQ
jgi:tetratricopeptide (TPR) repeat protein